jgi:hypothetical protein
MPMPADEDDVIVHGNAKGLRDVDDRLGHLDIGCDGVGSPLGWLCTNL